MHTIETYPGQHIRDVAHALVAAAPAQATFNGIRVRAKYATTNPADVAREYDWRVTLRSITWRNSAEGKALIAEAQAAAESAKIAWAAAQRDLLSLDMTNAAAVLSWLKVAAPAANHVAVKYDHASIVDFFIRGGWMPGANVGAAFTDTDPRNFAGWIVGQWLEYPTCSIVRFIDQWRRQWGWAFS